MENKNIYQKLLAITEEANKIPKRGRNTFSNYNYVMAIDVIGNVRKLLIKHRVHVSISEVGDLKRYRDGKNFHCETASVARFINVDDPKDYHEVNYHSVAADTLDKDIYKAKTGGLKYLFSQEFKIVTNDFIDPEDDATEKAMDMEKTQEKKPPEKSGEITTAQWEQILGIGKKKELTENEVIGLVKYCATLNKISPRHWQIAKLMLGEDNFQTVLDSYVDSLQTDKKS